MRIIKKISLNHDEKVLTWRDELFYLIEKPSQSNSVSDSYNSYCIRSSKFHGLNFHDPS